MISLAWLSSDVNTEPDVRKSLMEDSLMKSLVPRVHF